MIEGALSSTSFTKRTTALSARAAAVFGQVRAGEDADRRADAKADRRS